MAKVRDAVINELEVEKQSANAYLIWRDQERHEGAFRRGMSKIRQSFRRNRPASSEQPKLQGREWREGGRGGEKEGEREREREMN